MAIIVLKDRVKVSATTTGTGTFTLGAAANGYQDFSAIGNGNITYYTIAAQSGSEWEVGKGTVTNTAGTYTLSRDTVYESSNAGTLVNFSAGTKDVFVTYPAERAIYEEPDGQTLIDGGPITVLGSGVTVNPTLEAELGKFVSNVNSFGQVYNLNQNDGDTASADFVAYNDLTTDGFTYFTDMGISGSNYSSVDYPLFTPNSGYVFHQGDDFFLGNETTGKDVVLFAGGVDTTNEAVRIKGADQSVELASDISVAGTATITGAAEFQSTVLLDADPTLALQAATKQYVDQQVTAGLHIHEPVRVETTGNLTATYAQGGTTFNITDITSTTTVTTSVSHGLSVNDQIWLYTSAGNGLSTNTAYFVFSVPAANQLTLSLTFGGAQITGLTNASGLSYATRAKSGVGATLTNAGTQVALTVDGIALSATNRVMVRLQTNGAENGVYTVTTVGSGSTNWVLTRATDSNQVNPSDPNGVGTGDYYFTQEGVVNAGDSHVLTTEPNTMIIGYTPLTYTQFSGSVDYVGGTNISIVGQTISLTGTVAATNGGTGTNTVTTGDLLYGSGTNTWGKLAAGAGYKSLVMNAGGTNVEWNAVALNQSGSVSGTLPTGNGGTGLTTYTLGDLIYSSATNTLAKLAGSTSATKTFLTQTGTGAASAAPAWGTIVAADVSGLAASATTDTTNAANITSGTLPVARLSGSYTGITGVGTLAAGTWNGSTIAAAYGGTGQSSYAVGDLLYADTTTSLAKLADIASGNALLSGGVGTAPAWGKIGLTTHVSGTLAVANGGTGATDAATARSNLGAGTGNGSVTSVAAGSYLTGGTITTTGTLAVDADTANTAGKVVARDGSGNFAAGTITANLSGNAATVTNGVYQNQYGSFQASFTTNIDANTNRNTGVYGSYAASATNTPTTSGILWNGTSGSDGSGDGSQIWQDYSTNNLYARQRWGGGWSGWLTILSSNNYTSYAPSLTGSGASGTWGISVTGSAATLTTGRTIAMTGDVTYTSGSFNGSANVTGTSTLATVNSNVGSFTNASITVNAKGLITAASSGSGGGVTSITGTANQVVASASTGAVTLSLPQSIATGSSVQFGSFGVGTAASGTTGEIRATNNVTAFFSSDRKFKENIHEITSASQIVRAIGGKYFDWTDTYIADHGGVDGYFIQKQDFGVIAQDVLRVFPRAVRTRPDGSLAVDYEKLGVLAFPALVETMDRLDALEALVAQFTKGSTP